MALITLATTVADGSMKSTDKSFASVLPARKKFLEAHDLSAEQTTLVHLTYEGDDYCRYVTLTDADKGDGIVRPPSHEADAMVVTSSNHALLLPLADCIGAVIHDASRDILMVSHLGRHNLEQYGGRKCIEYLVKEHGCDPTQLTVWLSPAAGKESYPLYAFDNRSLHDVAQEQLVTAGIAPKNISVSPIDSATDQNYFSHSQFLKGNRDNDGRFAVIAMLHN